METSFCVVAAIALALAFAVFHGNNPPMQLPGQRSAMLPGKTAAPAESPGLTAGPGLPQREFK